MTTSNELVTRGDSDSDACPISIPRCGHSCRNVERSKLLKCPPALVSPMRSGRFTLVEHSANDRGSGGNDECGSLVNVHGVVIDRQTRSSDNFRWYALLRCPLASCPPHTADRELFVLRLRCVRCHRAGHWAGGVGETVLLELGQVGSAFDTIKVYIDCYRGAAAVCTGLLPGAV